jgi:hypothetical protein
MGSWIRRQGPGFVVACLALMVALGGSVYAAAKIDGRQVRPGSLPGNRVKPGTLPGNRLQPGTLRGGRIADGSLTGKQVDAATLAKVPEAERADSAGTAKSAGTALSASRAAEADRLNGHTAGCATDQRLFAGSCWDLVASPAATAPAAAASCSRRGGELPRVLALTAFAALPGVEVAAGGEWSGDVALISSENKYSVLTVSNSGSVFYLGAMQSLPYRCTTPLVT